MPTYSPHNIELMVPRQPDTAGRITEFYQGIGWHIEEPEEDGHYLEVTPLLPDSNAPNPALGYWQTNDPDKLASFGDVGPIYSGYSEGLRLPELHNLVEFSLLVPDDDAVRDVFYRGGQLLVSHLVGPQRVHDGRHEFRIADPFGYSIRVTRPRTTA